jgi:hypothetical protein
VMFAESTPDPNATFVPSPLSMPKRPAIAFWNWLRLATSSYSQLQRD